MLRSCAWVALCSTVTPWRLATGSVAARAARAGRRACGGHGAIEWYGFAMGARASRGSGGDRMDMVYYIGVKGFAVRSPRLSITHPTDSGSSRTESHTHRGAHTHRHTDTRGSHSCSQYANRCSKTKYTRTKHDFGARSKSRFFRAPPPIRDSSPRAPVSARAREKSPFWHAHNAFS